MVGPGGSGSVRKLVPGRNPGAVRGFGFEVRGIEHSVPRVSREPAPYEAAVPDLIIVGGGIIGLATAREAALRGLSVTIVDRGRPGREATWAAGGMLSPIAESEGDGPFLEFALASLRRYSSWIQAIQDEAGRSVEYRETGKLRLAFTESEREELARRRSWAEERGLAVGWFEPEELRREEPDLSLSVRGALLLEDDYRIDNRRLADALIEAARKAGVRFRSGVEVHGVVSTGDRVRGVVTVHGEELESDRVLVAAGAWSGALAGLPGELPVRPVRGQMLALRPDRLPSERVLESGEAYLIPRGGGRLLVGATVEDADFIPGITAEGIRSLLDGALRLVPGLGSASIEESWSGFRPGTPDGQPILGAHPDLEGLFVATGHFRNGILLAPLTGASMAALVADDSSGPSLPAAFAPGRARRIREHRPVGVPADGPA